MHVGNQLFPLVGKPLVAAIGVDGGRGWLGLPVKDMSAVVMAEVETDVATASPHIGASGSDVFLQETLAHHP